MSPSQLPFELPVVSSDAREDLVVSNANSIAVNLIDSWPQWPGNVVVLAGPVGSGKSHLAGIWARTANARILDMAALNADRPPERQNFLLEDAETGAINERALFHLINHVNSQRGHCMITSRKWPSQWQIALPDLASRLKAAQLVELSEPDDELLRQVIFKLLADRQLAFDPGVVDYLVTRMERSLEAANMIVAEIDREALAKKSRITRAIASAALKNSEKAQNLDQPGQ